MDRDIFTLTRRRKIQEGSSVISENHVEKQKSGIAISLIQLLRLQLKTMRRVRLSKRALTSGGLALLLVVEVTAAAVIPTLVNTDKFYELSSESKKIVGEVDNKLS